MFYLATWTVVLSLNAQDVSIKIFEEALKEIYDQNSIQLKELATERAISDLLIESNVSRHDFINAKQLHIVKDQMQTKTIMSREQEWSYKRLRNTLRSIDQRKISSDLVLGCGVSRSETTINYLTENLNNPKFDRKVILLFLARNKVVPYHEDLINEYDICRLKAVICDTSNKTIELSNYNFMSLFANLAYINTQESFRTLSFLLESKTKLKHKGCGSNHVEYIAEEIKDILLYYIQNEDFREIYRSYLENTPYLERTDQAQEKLYDELFCWMMKNFGSYELNAQRIPGGRIDANIDLDNLGFRLK